MVCIISVLSIVIASPAHAQQTLVFSGIEGSINHKLGESVLKIAYKRIDIDIDTVDFPAKRSLVMSNSGEFDGEVQRVDNISRQYPNLIKIPEPILFLESSVFVKDPNIRIENRTDLIPYLIGIPIGIRYLDEYTKGTNRIFIKDLKQLFHLLDMGRIDVVIIATNYGKSFLSRNNQLKIRMLEPPVIRIPLYHYLHRKHQYLIPSITEAIRLIKDDGTVDEMVKRFAGGD